MTVSDLGRPLEFYSGLLGGRLTYRFPDEGDPAFVTLDLGGATLGLGEGRDLAPAGRPTRVELADQPWGADGPRGHPDGNGVVIVAALPSGDAGTGAR
jgi:hypothetical protein